MHSQKNLKRKPVVAIIGRGECTVEEAAKVSETTKILAQNGVIILCGGLGGTMEAAAKGAKEAGGQTIGIIPGTNKEKASPYIDFVISSGMGEARNVLIVRSADVVIAFPGKYGTLSEIAFALVEKKPVISVGSWDVGEEIIKADSPTHAAQLALEIVKEDNR